MVASGDDTGSEAEHTPSSAPAPTVAIVDDEPDLLFVLERMLDSDGFDVVGTAGNGTEGVELVTQQQPDVVVLDLAMPGMSGEEAMARILKQAPSTMVAILSAQIDEEYGRELMKRGAFAAYIKGDLKRLPSLLRRDLDRFRHVLDGEDDVPAWARHFERL